ncbi:MAG: hypothetical protein GX256_01730 [Fretibacterium sp.]|nr:hypothetical protein [Fretibacterium sp.]
MILSVTLNPSVDMDFIVNGLRAGGRYRTNVSRRSPGGSGVNVSIILSRLGHPSVATGFLAGFNAYYILEELRREGVTTNFIHTQGETRISVCITDLAGDTETRLHEAGLQITKRDAEAFSRSYDRILGRVDQVVLGGSLPPGLSSDFCINLLRKAKDSSISVVVCPREEDREIMLAEYPTIVSLDLATLAPGYDDKDSQLQKFLAQAVELHRHGTQWVVTCEPGRVIFSTPQGTWTAKGSADEMKYSYASEDALLAGLLAALDERMPFEEALRFAAACFWECTTHPEKFPANREALDQFLPQLVIDKLD